MTTGAGNRFVSLDHLADGFKLILTMFTFVFINGHNYSILRIDYDLML